MWKGWEQGVLVITLEATRNVYRKAGVKFADLFDDIYTMMGSVIIHTAHDDGHWLTSAAEGGGFLCSMPTTSIREQIEKCKKNHGQLEMRLNNHSSVTLLSTVALSDQEYNETASETEDKFFFAQEIKDLPGNKKTRNGRNNEGTVTQADPGIGGW